MIYILVFMASVFFAWLAERSKNKSIIILCSVISILIPSILGGLRAHEIGVDNSVYGLPHALQALNSPDLVYFMTHNRGEPLYKIVVYFTMKTLGHVNWCYFFYQLITVSCFYIGVYKHRKFVSLSFTMFIFYLILYLQSYNLMRQCMAISIIFMGLNTLECKQYFRFAVYIAIATLFHYSSTITVVTLLGLHFMITSNFLKENSYLYIIVLCVVIVSFIFITPLILTISSFVPFLLKYTSYFDGSFGTSVPHTSDLVLILGELIMLIFYYQGAKRTFSKLGKNNLDYFIANAIIVFCINYAITTKFMGVRFSLYSHSANIILLSSMPKFVREKHLRKLVSITIGAVAMFFWWNIFIRYNYGMVWPYRSILD